MNKFVNDLVDMHWKCDELTEQHKNNYWIEQSFHLIKRELEVLLLDAGHSLKGLKLAPREYSDE